MIGHNASNVSNNVIDVYQGNLVMISPTSFALNHKEIKKTREGKNYIFTMAFSINSLVSELAKEIENSSKESEKILLCTDSLAHDQVRLKDMLVEDQKINVSGTECDFSKYNLDILEEAANSGVTSSYLGPHVSRINDAITMAKMAKEMVGIDGKPKFRLYASPTLFTAETLLSGKDIEGLVLTIYWHPEANDDNKSSDNNKNSSFYTKAEGIWGKGVDITWRTAMAYDAIQVIFEGLKKIPSSEESTREKLQQKIVNGCSGERLTGDVVFKSDGSREGESVYLMKVEKKDDKYKFSEIKN